MAIPKEDLPYLERHRKLAEGIAGYYDLDPYLILAIISRESGGGRLLGKYGNPPLTGDDGHGRGLMQIDDRWHDEFLAVDSEEWWKEAPANIAYGCYLLHKNYAYFYRKDVSEPIKAATAAYNCGLGNVKKALRKGVGVDHYTAGGDYSADVLSRRDELKELMVQEEKSSCPT